LIEIGGDAVVVVVGVVVDKASWGCEGFEIDCGSFGLGSETLSVADVADTLGDCCQEPMYQKNHCHCSDVGRDLFVMEPNHDLNSGEDFDHDCYDCWCCVDCWFVDAVVAVVAFVARWHRFGLAKAQTAATIWRWYDDNSSRCESALEL
jgi:hypothetical protein